MKEMIEKEVFAGEQEKKEIAQLTSKHVKKNTKLA